MYILHVCNFCYIQIVIDELHLFLRVMDILLRNLIHADDNADHQNIFGNSSTHMDTLCEKIRSCGVTFRVIMHYNYNYEHQCNYRFGSQANKDELQWSKLRGNDCKKLISKLPEFIPDVIPGVNGVKIKKLWMVKLHVYNYVYYNGYYKEF